MDGRVLRFVLGLTFLLSSCTLETGGLGEPVEVWLESPLPGAGEIGIPLGQSLPVYGHTRMNYGRTIRNVVLLVNGTPFVDLTLSLEGANLYKVSGVWTAVAEGTYKLKLRAFSTSGESADSKEVKVKVTYSPMLFVTPTPTLAFTLEAVPTPTETPLDTPTFTLTAPPSATATMPPTITSTNTPWPAVKAEFWADQTSLTKGECTFLHWKVKHATSVTLNNKKVEASGSQKVCPSETSGYDLLAKAPSGDVLRELTITVTTPQDKTPPPVPTPIKPGSPNSQKPPLSNCEPLQWTAVSDPSGVVYKIQLDVRSGGNWIKKAEWTDITGTSQDISKMCGWGFFYRWRVIARDGAGNWSNWSPWFYFNTPIT